MPTFHNPAGPTATLERRKELLALAQEFDTLILEDDAYGDLRFEGEFIPSLYALDDSEGVIRAGTLSKILGAGMRLGWLIAPKSLIPILQSFNFGGGVAPFTSRVATYYMRDHMEHHIPKLIDVYRAKRDAMLAGPRTRRWKGPTPRSASPLAASSSGSSCRPPPIRRNSLRRRARPASVTFPAMPSCRMAAASASFASPSATSPKRIATPVPATSVARSAPRWSSRLRSDGGGDARIPAPSLCL